MRKISHSTQVEAHQGDEKGASAKMKDGLHTHTGVSIELADNNAPAEALGLAASSVKAPRKLIEDEAIAAGRVKQGIVRFVFRTLSTDAYSSRP